MAQASTILSDQCCGVYGVCSSTQHVLRCSQCNVMCYFSADHQASHYTKHKSECNTIAKRTGIVYGEAQRLHDCEADPFVSSVGHFWDASGTRPYMRARFALVEAFMKIKTYASVQAQLDHLTDMMRLCRSDSMGLRDLVPAMMLRLNKDQECYDFIKWCCTVGCDDHYDSEVNVKNADAFESVGYLEGITCLSHAVAIVLLKIKLLMDLTAIENSTDLSEKLPSDILGQIQGHVVRSLIVVNDKDKMDRASIAPVIAMLESQIDSMYTVVAIFNRFFWPALHLVEQ